jgi:hypothetical protein
MLSKQNILTKLGIPPTVVGGFFKFISRNPDLNHPPTAVGGIRYGVGRE